MPKLWTAEDVWRLWAEKGVKQKREEDPGRSLAGRGQQGGQAAATA